MARYAVDVVPERYSMFRVDSLKRRVKGVEGAGVHDAWAVVSNIADHATMIAMAAMRRYEKTD